MNVWSWIVTGEKKKIKTKQAQRNGHRQKKRHCFSLLLPCLLWIHKKRTDPYLINGCFPGCILLGELLWGYSWLPWLSACMSGWLHFCTSRLIGWEEQRHLCPSSVQRLSGRSQVSLGGVGVSTLSLHTHMERHTGAQMKTHSSVSSLLDSLSHLLLKWLARSSKLNPRFHKVAWMNWWVAAVRIMCLFNIEKILDCEHVSVGLLCEPVCVSFIICLNYCEKKFRVIRVFGVHLRWNVKRWLVQTWSC